MSLKTFSKCIIFTFEKKEEKKKVKKKLTSLEDRIVSRLLYFTFFPLFFSSLSFFLSFVNDNVKNTIQITHILCPNPKLFTYDVLTLKQKRLYIYISYR